MRLTQTGTGRGQVVGRGRLDFHAQPDRTIRSCAVSWDGDAVFVPLLPGLAFDQYFPNLRDAPREGRVVRGKELQRAVLEEFEEWVDRARATLNVGETPPLFETPPVASPAPGEHISESAEFVVRFNQGNERLWSETSYASRQGEQLLFSIKHQVLWDWCTGQGEDVTTAMLEALERQFDHYDVHGIPSDFMMRQIGRAPYAAWKAL